MLKAMLDEREKDLKEAKRLADERIDKIRAKSERDLK